MALLELLRKVELEEDVDFLREGVRAMAQQLMELEVLSISEPTSTSEPPIVLVNATGIATVMA